MTHIGTALNIAAHTFFATWSAFGSFEKGELFGLPNVVATTNLTAERLKGFENHDHFKTNIGPFAPTRLQMENMGDTYASRKLFGQCTRTISYVLADHPLKKWIDEVINIDWPAQESTPTSAPQNTTSKEWLCHQLSIAVPTRLTKEIIADAVEGKNTTELNKLLDKMMNDFPPSDSVLKRLTEIVEQRLNEQT